jgi:hypothetical protein
LRSLQPPTHAAPRQARGAAGRRAIVVARRIELMLKARPRSRLFLMGVSRSGDRPQRCDLGRGRRDAAAVVAGDFASSNAGVLLAHRGESCRPGVVSSEPDMGDAVRFFKASGIEAEGREARLRWGIAPQGLHSRARARPAVCRMPRWRTRHVACDAQHALRPSTRRHAKRFGMPGVPDDSFATRLRTPSRASNGRTPGAPRCPIKRG